MAYGRLDVFWPDGVFMTFPLVDNNISVGRSTGNSITLDTSTISRYHFSLTFDGQQVAITDLESVNGTFVDGVRLVTNEPRLLYGGEEIQIGHLRMIYNHIEEIPTQPIQAQDETTQRIEIQQATFRVDMIGPDIAVSPGAHASAEIAVTNTGDQAQVYTVQVSGLPADWVRVDRSQFALEPNETGQALINFRPTRHSDTRPGDYSVAVQVAPENSPRDSVEARLTLTVLAFSSFSLALETRTIAKGERFRLRLENPGSSTLPLTLSGRDLSGRLRFNLPTSQVMLVPGQKVTVQGEVLPRSRAWFGSERRLGFDLLARSGDASRFLVAARGYYIEQPPLPSWSLFVIIALAFAALMLILTFGAALFLPSVQPRLADFQVSGLQIAQGQPLELRWTASDVREYRLILNGTAVPATIQPGAASLTLDTAGLSGDVQIFLVGLNGDQQSAVTQSVYVYQPLGEGFFTTTPTQLVRHVVQTLTIGWSVPGAVVTRLSGMEAFSTAPLEPSYGADATLTGIVGIALDPFTLTLYAEDEVGNSREQTLNIQVVDPQCAPAREPVKLHAGPDERQQVISTVPTGTNVVVDAQDSSGVWLRVPLPGGLFGWGQTARFACAPIFNVSDLYKELAVPTVPPSPTSQFSPTPGAGTPSATPTGRPGRVTPTATAAG